MRTAHVVTSCCALSLLIVAGAFGCKKDPPKTEDKSSSSTSKDEKKSGSKDKDKMSVLLVRVRGVWYASEHHLQRVSRLLCISHMQTGSLSRKKQPQSHTVILQSSTEARDIQHQHLRRRPHRALLHPADDLL